MATAKDILSRKGKLVYTLSPKHTIQDALNLLCEKEIGAVVITEEEKVVGIFSERDYARRGTMLGNSLTTPLQKVMTKVIYYVSPNESVECCLAQMSDKHIRHLPVISDEKLVGLVSMGDVVKDLIQDQKELIVGLENSILGREIQH